MYVKRKGLYIYLEYKVVGVVEGYICMNRGQADKLAMFNLPLHILVGGAYTFLGNYPMLRSNTTPNTPKHPKSPHKLHPLQQCHLGKFHIHLVV